MKKLLLNLIAIMIVMGASAQTWNYVTNSGTDYILYGMSFPPDQSIVGYACGMDEHTINPALLLKLLMEEITGLKYGR